MRALALAVAIRVRGYREHPTFQIVVNLLAVNIWLLIGVFGILIARKCVLCIFRVV